MQVVLLGTAAGGGFPQWNCWCPTCRIARSDPARARVRTQSSVAVSADGERWLLCNASPDVREQIAHLAGSPLPADRVRHVPIEGVVLTDAELDHTLGLLLLREARRLKLYATAPVLGIIERASRILPTMRAFADVQTATLPLGAPVSLRLGDGTESGLTAEAFPVAGDPPRFAGDQPAGHTVGLVIRDQATGGSCAFVPGCGTLDDEVVARLAGTDLVLFDGTFWDDDELAALGISESRAREMGHVPISGPGGSLHRLGSIGAGTRVYTHINNTNPILVEDSPEHRAVRNAGILVGEDGTTFHL